MLTGAIGVIHKVNLEGVSVVENTLGVGRVIPEFQSLQRGVVLGLLGHNVDGRLSGSVGHRIVFFPFVRSYTTSLLYDFNLKPQCFSGSFYLYPSKNKKRKIHLILIENISNRIKNQTTRKTRIKNNMFPLISARKLTSLQYTHHSKGSHTGNKM